MKFLIVMLIGVGVIIAGIVLFVEFSQTSTNGVAQLTVTAERTPFNEKIHTPEQLANLEALTTPLDNSTLERIPVLENAINQAFSELIPSSFNSSQSFTTDISQSDSDSILRLAGNNVNELPETQSTDPYVEGNYTTYAAAMEFKFNNFFYRVVIEKTTVSQDEQPNNSP